ncbi:MAG: putative regulator of amino acid metabolism [Candidatus Alkanophagales archaeon MCA70_species_2]|nr:putative regulator of amino acid metabolism [Candidatus Alkanophaga liquidiphilum]
MWGEIMGKFEKTPSQKKVVRLLLERGFRIDAEGRISSGNIRIPHSQVAKEAGVDRRVVDMTVKAIMADDTLRRMFENLRSVPLLDNIAPLLNLGVVIIYPKDARDKGILSEVTTVISKHGLSIRQAVSDDPYFVEEPKLTIIIDGQVPGRLIEELRRTKGVKSVQVL